MLRLAEEIITNCKRVSVVFERYFLYLKFPCCVTFALKVFLLNIYWGQASASFKVKLKRIANQ